MAEKKKRDKPCKPRGVPSKGTAKMSKHPLGELEKVLLGKGAVQALKPVRREDGSPVPAWRGGVGKAPFDAEQAAWNKANLPFLWD